MSDLEFRSVPFSSFEVREEADSWTLDGIAVPWGQVIEVGGYKESFERGAFGEYDGKGLLFSSHDHQVGGLPIGTIVEAEDREDGYHIKARISQTAKGTEVRQLLKDGVLKSLSVGFKPIAAREEDGVTVRTAAQLREVSVVPFPAYADAAITAVRSLDQSAASAVDLTETKGSTMTDITADVTEVRSEIEDLSRRFTVLEETRGASSAPVSKFRSFGEFVKGLDTRDANREDIGLITRAFTGATLTDANVQVPWVNKTIELIAERRNILELFPKSPLPATGKTFEFPKFSSKSGSVTVQANEGDDLTYNEVIVTDAAVDIKTYGGYSSLSRQSIERSTVAYLDVVLRNLVNEYAKATNGAVRAALTGGTYSNAVTLAFADKGKGATWVDTVIQANDLMVADTGNGADVWIMSSAHFRQLATIVDTAGRPVFVVNNDGVNTFGNVNISGLSASIGGVSVVVDPALTGTASYIVNRDAVLVAEDASRFLQDENIINLTKDFSIYGYLAVAVTKPDAVTKVTHPTS